MFLYGCSPSLSWMNEDTDNPAVVGARMEDTSYKVISVMGGFYISPEEQH